MSRLTLLFLLLLGCARADAFCGFYVASGDAKLFNHASQVVLARDGDRTVMTISSDYQGDPAKFAMVVPVPVVLKRGQIHVTDTALVAKLDAWSAPRLVEYTDPDPCQMAKYSEVLPMMVSAEGNIRGGRMTMNSVHIEARYEVDEYDVLILSARESGALAIWLRANGYTIPSGAARSLEAYVKQGMKFFVAKIDLSRRARAGLVRLRPLQIAYESPKFVLPVRLGMANADGPQELFVYTITRKGRVEPVNYRSVKLPSDAEVPEFVKDDFAHFYRDLFGHATEVQRMGVVFTEYAWDAAWCDPCAGTPLAWNELRELGAMWLDGSGGRGAPNGAFVTRLHARYDRASFPEDLVLQVTEDRQNFQGRFVIRHPWTGTTDCPGAVAYRSAVRERRSKQAFTLAELTGWPVTDIHVRMEVDADWATREEKKPWWEKMWSR